MELAAGALCFKSAQRGTWQYSLELEADDEWTARACWGLLQTGRYRPDTVNRNGQHVTASFSNITPETARFVLTDLTLYPGGRYYQNIETYRFVGEFFPDRE